MSGCPINNQVAISGCPPQLLVVFIHYKGEFWLQIYGCPPDNCIIIFGCQLLFLLLSWANRHPLFHTLMSALYLLSNWEEHCSKVLTDRNVIKARHIHTQIQMLPWYTKYNTMKHNDKHKLEYLENWNLYTVVLIGLAVWVGFYNSVHTQLLQELYSNYTLIAYTAW